MTGDDENPEVFVGVGWTFI